MLVQLDICTSCGKWRPYPGSGSMCLRCLSDILIVFERRIRRFGLKEMVPLEDRLRGRS